MMLYRKLDVKCGDIETKISDELERQKKVSSGDAEVNNENLGDCRKIIGVQVDRRPDRGK